MTHEYEAGTRYTRQNLPPEIADPDNWPQLDETTQPPDRRDWIAARKSAIRAYLRGDPLRVIATEFGLADAEVLRHLNRCVQRHADGEIYGFRALVPYQPVKAYRRIVRPVGQAGLAGAFTQFLSNYADLRTQLNAVILGEFGDSLPESRASHRAVYSKFKRLCRTFGIAESQYPFTCKDEGRRSMRRYVRSVLQASFVIGAERMGGKDAAVRSEVGTGMKLYQNHCAPFDEVSIDAHALNFIGTIVIPTSTGCRPIPIHRLQFLPLVEHSCGLILGYQVAIGRQPGAEDVVAAVKNALGCWTPRELQLAGFRYPPGAMMPSALPGAQGLCWSSMYVDNASIHFSNALAERIRRVTGAAVNWGPVGKWYRRPLIEALFSALERHGFIRLPNSTGYGPGDPQRADAVANAVKHSMDLEELLDLIDVCVSTHNATAQASIDNLSPLQRLKIALDTASERWLPRRLPLRPPQLPDLDVEVLTKTIRGNQRKGRRPYIQIEHVRYTSPVLANSPRLIGTQLQIHVRKQDLRTVRAFLASGEELGILIAQNNWGRTPHDVKMRRQIISAMHEGNLVVPSGTDPIQEFLVLKAKQAVERSTNRKSTRERISDEATDLARGLQISGEPVPLVPERSKISNVPTADYDVVRAPSFLPTISHKGRLK